MEELKTELMLLKETKKDEKNTVIQLQQEHAALTKELTKEKVTHTVFRMAHSFEILLRFSAGSPKPQLTFLLFSTGACGLPLCAGGAGEGGFRGTAETAEGGDGGGVGRAGCLGGPGAEQAGGGGEQSGVSPGVAGGKQ